MYNLLKHLAYINQRKEELERLDKWELISKLVIKELEVKEYEKEETNDTDAKDDSVV